MGILDWIFHSLEMALRTAVLPALMLAVLTATLVRVESSPLASDRAAVKTHAQKAESRLFWITLLLAKRRCFETCKAVDLVRIRRVHSYSPRCHATCSSPSSLHHQTTAMTTVTMVAMMVAMMAEMTEATRLKRQ